MISQWKVLQCVAQRYGKVEPVFDEARAKLALVKAGQMPLASLEDNMERLQLRMAREEGSMAVALERINGTPDFQDIFIFEALSRLSKSVCRILRRGAPMGTGFLVAPDVIITNHHVIDQAEDAGDMLAEFDYELDVRLLPKKTSCFRLNAEKFFLTSGLEPEPDVPFSGPDFTFIGLETTGINGEDLADRRPVRLDGNKGKIIKGESCVIIQHPNGLPKKVVLKDTAFFSETGTRLVYESDTLPGSSGSMVVGLGTCEIIALHHAGLPRTDGQNRILTKTGALATAATPDDEIDWIGNEGIKVSKIIEALQAAALPAAMEVRRRDLLRNTELVEERLQDSPELPDHMNTGRNKGTAKVRLQSLPGEAGIGQSTSVGSRATFLITAPNGPAVTADIKAMLEVRYGKDITFALSMPASAVPGKVELFYLDVPFSGDVHEEAARLTAVPGILNAEADVTLALNTGPGFDAPANPMIRSAEGLIDEGFGTPNETDFLATYRDRLRSPYIVNKTEAEIRRWNWAATRFDVAIGEAVSPEGVRIVQFDTGFTLHTKVDGGFDTDQDHNFLEVPDDASDRKETGVLRQPGHGTRTGSLLIGREETLVEGNGNSGLLSRWNYRLVPYRIASSVILIDRQQQLAAALDRAIARGFDIITMSMGLPPTIATAKMAKKAYDNGIIWCCAAGNQVQAVISPAVFPGTIAVAASNPMDRDWPASSRGDAVDITAPGQDVYVPILVAEGKEGFAYGDGTSYATPHVAAAAAYWLARYRDVLDTPEYAGWRRVEAFRQALIRSARKSSKLPTAGFGAGILDAAKLLKTPPLPPKQLEKKYAYDSWNEQAFFATVQGYGEMLKTYWNRIHGGIFGTPRGRQESMMPGTGGLSPMTAQLERALFPGAAAATESAGAVDGVEMLDRFVTLQGKVEAAARKLPKE